MRGAERQAPWDFGEARFYLHLAEFDFRDNRRGALKISDAERAEDLLRVARDKRLTILSMWLREPSVSLEHRPQHARNAP